MSETDLEPPSTLPALFAERVAWRGDHPAIVTIDETISYAELDRRSARMARALLAIGAGKGARIALLAPDGVLWITTLLAAARIGALLTAVSTLCAPRELAHILRNSDVQIVIAARRFLRNDYAGTLEAALPSLASGKAEGLRLASAPHLRSVSLDDPAGKDWAKSVEDLLARADAPGAPDAALLAEIEEEVVPSDDAVVIYTSGSTSLPKAVIHRQWTLARHPPELAKLFLLKPEDRMMPLLPLFWVGGLAMALEVISVGGTLVYPSSPRIEDVLDMIERHDVNRLNSWGALLIPLRQAAIERGIDVDRIIGLGEFRDENGALIPPPLQVNMLGMSESFCPHSAERLDLRMADDKAGSSGRAVNGYERRVVDPETRTVLPPGEVGELELRGPALTTGFYKRARSEVFTPDGFYPTGDLCRIDAEGWLYFVARRVDMIKTKAANVSRLEVEAALRALPEVEFALVAGLPDPEYNVIVAAAVVPAPGTHPTEGGLKTALRDALSSFKIPRRIVFINQEDVPVTQTGKIKLFEAADLIAHHLDAPVPAE
jgi:acyl-CoA synthetase (AMP-forming)/AMP-acid ligase II